ARATGAAWTTWVAATGAAVSVRASRKRSSPCSTSISERPVSFRTAARSRTRFGSIPCDFFSPIFCGFLLTSFAALCCEECGGFYRQQIRCRAEARDRALSGLANQGHMAEFLARGGV